MLFRWFTRRRRRRIRSRPFPDQWLDHVRAAVPRLDYMSAEQQEKLLGDVQVFVAEKNWEGCGGQEMSDRIKLTIAAQACLLTLALDVGLYDRVQSILVYPSSYLAPDRTHLGGGLTIEGQSHRLGEAWYRGPVILAWDELDPDYADPHDGNNVALHEFAHQLDMRTGSLDGTPPLADRRQAKQWHEVMSKEFRRLIRAAEAGRATLLDEYGATDETEFFAVATECFFEQGAEMKRRHERLYELFCQFYQQDTADWGD